MEKKEPVKFNLRFERFASKVTYLAGRPGAFLIAFVIVAIGLFLGSMFEFSQDWQRILEGITTLITFLLLFIIQHSQNKDSLAIQFKLNEIVAALDGASNRLINVEDLSEDELKVLGKFYSRLSSMAKEEDTLRKSHSVEDAREIHEREERASRN